PLAVHVLLRALRGDLDHADLDPLTALLNRRAFRRQTLAMIARPCMATSRAWLVATTAATKTNPSTARVEWKKARKAPRVVKA
ncbi:hypothetical protein C6A85_14765, partial [Mycobacterium sp. ITM-2017-0098]